MGYDFLKGCSYIFVYQFVIPIAEYNRPINFNSLLQVGTPGCDLNKNLGLDTASWAITSDGTIQTNRQVETKLDKKIQEGDIIVGL